MCSKNQTARAQKYQVGVPLYFASILSKASNVFQTMRKSLVYFAT